MDGGECPRVVHISNRIVPWDQPFAFVLSATMTAVSLLACSLISRQTVCIRLQSRSASSFASSTVMASPNSELRAWLEREAGQARHDEAGRPDRNDDRL